MIVYAPISVGELIDKITILKIKCCEIQQPERLLHCQQELALLEALRRDLDLDPNIDQQERLLHQVNQELWHIEDFKRGCERDQNFGAEFVAAARQVYKKNDLRAQIKREINEQAGSAIQEQKSYC